MKWSYWIITASLVSSAALAEDLAPIPTTPAPLPVCVPAAVPAVPPAPVKSIVVAGKSLLADSNGRTLYVFDVDTDQNSKCFNGCERSWPPMILQATDVLKAPFDSSIRPDGSRQLTINGHPLYYYKGDVNPGDINGDGIGDVWHVVPF